MVLPIAGETGWATKMNDHINSLELSAPIPVGRSRQLGTIFQNGGAFYGGSLGTEYGVGIRMEAQNIDALGHQMNTISTDVTSVLLVTLRTLELDGSLSVPLVQTSFNLNGPTQQLNVFTPIAIPRGIIALTWCRLNEASGTGKTETIVASSDMCYFASATSFPATGHGPSVVTLQSGITTTIPNTTIVPPAQTTNSATPVPAIIYRRSA